MNVIRLYDIINSSEAETPESGNKVYKEIVDRVKSYVEREEDFSIDFSDIRNLTTAFLNNAIGKLFFEIASDKLIQHMRFTDVPSSQVNTIRWSLTNAIKKSKQKNKDMFFEI